MNVSKESVEISTGSLFLKASLVPWDTEVFQFPVAQITHIDVMNTDQASKDYSVFQEWVDVNMCSLISCRLSHSQMLESILLEGKGFRFIEMVLHPKFEGLEKLNIPHQDLQVDPANIGDLPVLRQIAESAFGHERFHCDPRLDRRRGDLRYGRWVANTLTHPRQQLLKILDGESLIAFFIIETKDDGIVYWHLTAVSPEYQGRGYGRRVWLTMLHYHQKAGHRAVSTTISARNTPVLNLYASLNFRFLPPEMTFHWVK